MILQRYEYVEIEENGNMNVCSYTIKKGITPLHYHKEKMVQEFEMEERNAD